MVITATPFLRRQRRINRAIAVAYRVFCVLNVAAVGALLLATGRTLIDWFLIVAAAVIIVVIHRSEEYAWARKAKR